MNGSGDWSILLDAGVGAGALLIGIGLFIVCLRTAKILSKAADTIDTVDRQLVVLTPPIVQTLNHMGGIANTADSTLARLTTVVDAVEGLAGGVAKSANAAQSAVNPALANFGVALTTVSARLRKFVRGRSPVDLDV